MPVSQPRAAALVALPWYAIPAITLAGMGCAAIETVFGIVFAIVSAIGAPGQWNVLIWGLPTLLIAVFAAMFVCAFLSTALMIVATLFNITLGDAITPLTLAGCVGGLTGFFVSAFGLMGSLHQYDPWWAGALVVLGVGFSTIACHIAAYYQVRRFQFLLAADELAGGLLTDEKLSASVANMDCQFDVSESDKKKVAAIQAEPMVHPLDEPDDLPLEERDPVKALPRKRIRPRRQRQWTLTQAFVLTVWFALAAAMVSAIGDASVGVAVFLTAYGALQLVSFGVLYFCRGTIERRLQRKTLEFVNATVVGAAVAGSESDPRLVAMLPEAD